MALLLARVRALADEVPGVVSIKAGDNITDRAQGYSHGIIVTLADREALRTYLEHPEHVALGSLLRVHCDVLALDFVDAGS
ncbi:hypothetical protein HRUBRA_01419 [Pseudohaliea rubra DSM 19751]|uniref:Stress-response A/B barrel domain-containing protein n=2 Tax=Pseudohaliea TaxID=1341120 RepID=A0A095WZ49_9GAMM|nr:hypothetical protein HRUBRA_01419 [Pseudohaliea rubra DSM 19751]